MGDSIGHNMRLDDVLAILGRVGTVTLRKGTNDVSASPRHKADTAGWKCELTIEGYLVPYGHGGPGGSPLRIGNSALGQSPAQAAADTLSHLEAWLASEDAVQCRACYLRSLEWHNGRASNRTAGYGETIYRHQKMVPEARIEWGDA